MFLFLIGHMLSLAILSHTLMAHADRTYLNRLACVLAVVVRNGEPERRKTEDG